MYKILTYNQLSEKGLSLFPGDTYHFNGTVDEPDAILLRSHQLSPEDLSPSLKAITRAGAGVNNIPVDACTQMGITVFNTPGANANAVKELVLTGMLLSSRGILGGLSYVQELSGISDKKELKKLVEKEKKNFKGQEIYGKTLGVVGLGAIGSLVAEMGILLGMNVVGYDPALSVDAAWRLSSGVRRMDDLKSLLAKSDYITLHLPVFDSTRNLINAEAIKHVKNGARLLNFAREEIVDDQAVVKSIEDGSLSHYVTDFPSPTLIGNPQVYLLPHLGASTVEAEENCAVMAVNQLRDFLENGNIVNSVNFPHLQLERTSDYRLALCNRNVPKMLGSILSLLADRDINVNDMLNKSLGDIAYNLIDIASAPPDDLVDALRNIDGVIGVRSI